ncbi:hypothetical protein [Streptomyces sp. 7N604]|uniref:hypothetical protein n=1 Tax=Streptomyces sp. 7N604 TaxID=3457415 RepID=UPI003FD3E51A
MPYPRRAVQVPLAGGLPELLRRVRYEVLPTRSAEDKVVGCVLADVPVAVTASPARGLGPTLDLAVALAGHGYRVVPHLPARQLVDDAHLADVVDRLLAAGIDDVSGHAGPPRRMSASGRRGTLHRKTTVRPPQRRTTVRPLSGGRRSGCR